MFHPVALQRVPRDIPQQAGREGAGLSPARPVLAPKSLANPFRVLPPHYVKSPEKEGDVCRQPGGQTARCKLLVALY